VVGGQRLRGRRSLRRSYLTLLGEARDRIFLASAYFAPETWLRRELARAARRGVRVDLLLPGRSDVPVVGWAGRASYERLLEAGVRIREMDHAVLHAKIAAFDDRALLAGSANLDYRSFRHNLEIAVNVFDEDVAADTLRVFEAEHARSRDINLDAWKRRSLTSRFRERIAYWIRYWL
jgi:cardiolipin synthase